MVTARTLCLKIQRDVCRGLDAAQEKTVQCNRAGAKCLEIKGGRGEMSRRTELGGHRAGARGRVRETAEG